MKSMDVEITHLEMRERPSPRVRAPLIDGLLLQRAHDIPLHFYRYLYNAVGKSHTWTDRLRLSDEALGAILQDTNVEVWILSVAAVPVGYIELDFNAYPKDETWETGSAWISYFGLVPEYQGRGLGPYLLSEGIHRAFDRGATRLCLHTNSADHPRALPSYQRAGFSPFRRSRGNLHLLSDADRLRMLG